MKEIEQIFDNLFNYYKVNTMQELAIKMDISQPALSKWRKRNSIEAAKRKCRELGIYSEIFGDLEIFKNQNLQTIGSISGGQIAQNVQNQNDSNQQNNKNIDTATFNLFQEAYEKAVKNNDLKSLRIYLMEY